MCIYVYIYICKYVYIYIYIHICVCFRGWQAIQAISVPGAQTEGSGGAWAIQGFPKMGTFLQQNIGFPLKTFPTAWSLALVWLHFLFGCDIGILVQKQEKVRTIGLSRICLLGGWHWDWAQPWRPAKNCDAKNQRSKYDAPQSWSFSIVTPSPPPKVIRIDKVNFCSP